MHAVQPSIGTGAGPCQVVCSQPPQSMPQLPKLVAMKRVGFVGTPWFPPERTVRAGVIGCRVFLDVRDVLSIITTSSAALRTFFATWFDGFNLEKTLNRFGLDRSHWLFRCTWGAAREERVACSLHLALVVLRHCGGGGADLNIKLAAELESRLGLGFGLDVCESKPAPPSAEVTATLEAMKASIQGLSTKLDAAAATPVATAAAPRRRSAEEDLDAVESHALKRAKHETAMATLKFERENPQKVFRQKYDAIREEIGEATQAGDADEVMRLRKLLTKLIMA
jgi:hypothetical protein